MMLPIRELFATASWKGTGSKMEQLLYLGWAVIPSGQVPARHYFLELLNTPECIWGIRVFGVAAAILVLFLQRKLKEKNGE